MKSFRLFIILTLIFTVVVFISKNYFFSDAQVEKEEEYLEYTLPKYHTEETEIEAQSATEKKEKISYEYFPDEFASEVELYRQVYENVLGIDIFYDKILSLDTQLHKKKVDVRGRMKQKTIKLFGVMMMKQPEFLSVAIHEFAHYVDLYYFDKKLVKDISDEFYSISWQSAKVLLAGQKQADFVSGYAMSNKYEDFSESFTYYVFHNKDFLEKALASEHLKKKYDFFGRYLFKSGEFEQTDFSEFNQVKNYYRDITKINFNLENFLQYLQK